MFLEKKPVIVIVGPTAVGKTALALYLAEEFSTEVISADSMQIYRGLDIGTAKPSKEDLRTIPHHMVDIVNPDEKFSVGDYVNLARPIIENLHWKNKVPIITGGTGLYIRALIDGLCSAPGADWKLREKLLQDENRYGRGYLYMKLKEIDPVCTEKIRPGDMVRIIRAIEVYEKTGTPLSKFHVTHAFGEERYAPIFIGLEQERSVLYKKINKRVDEMIDMGLVSETRWLLDNYGDSCVPASRLGYRQMGSYIRGECPLDKAIGLLKRDTRHYAKRQLTWFRRERRIKWFIVKDEKFWYEEVKSSIKDLISSYGVEPNMRLSNF